MYMNLKRINILFLNANTLSESNTNKNKIYNESICIQKKDWDYNLGYTGKGQDMSREFS